MATTVAPPADQAADLLQKLSLDAQTKTLDSLPEPTKKPTADSGKGTNGQIQPYERSMTPLSQDFVDPSMCFFPGAYPYFYGTYDGNANDWGYLNPDGVEMSPGVYGENGSLMYHGYGYAPYAPYSPATSPGPTVGHDGQLYGPQHYQYPNPYFQPPTPTSGPYNPSTNAPPKVEISTSAADQSLLPVDTAKGNSNVKANGGGVKGSSPIRPTYQNSSFNSNGSYGKGALSGGIPASGYQDLRFGYDGLRSPNPWLDVPPYSDGQRPVRNNSVTPSILSSNNMPSSRNQNGRPHSHMNLHHPRPISGMNTANGYMNSFYPSKLYGQYGDSFRSGLAFGSNGYDSRANGRGWYTVESKYKPRGRGNGYFGYGNENMDGLNEMNRGPRAKSSKNQKGFVAPPIALAVKGQNIPINVTADAEKDKLSAVPDREQFNKTDFSENYTDAKFFIIKSYSEDDVHKSIKYNVWASTPNGNRKLDTAYLEAQQKSDTSPVFLFFSVNTSGQFVGVAEMIGAVDFHKNVEYWQQDKWNGNFPVKWHIVKDVPNSLLKHITLENNDNKPVTNSRDTQEVKLEQGLQMLKIFKEYSSKTCILDDFTFYEGRQKTIQEKKAKQQQFQKQVCKGKPDEEKSKEEVNGEVKLQKSSEAETDLVKDPAPVVQTNISENGSSITKPIPVASEKKNGAATAAVAANGIANGC